MGRSMVRGPVASVLGWFVRSWPADMKRASGSISNPVNPGG
jgi:hypothetical protein